MKLVAFPNTPDKKTFTVTGISATIGSAKDNSVVVNGEGVSDYQASLTYSDGVWLIESLDEKPIIAGGENAPSLELKAGSKFSIAGIEFLVLDAGVIKAEAPALAPGGNQVALGNSNYGVAAPGTFYDPYESFVIHTSDTLAKLGLVFAALGPFVIGIGEIIGLVLCILSISRGRNTVRGTIMAWLGIIISLVWCAAIGIGVFYLTTRDVQASNERRVAIRLEKTALDEFYIKYAVLIDDDGDMFGEFAGPERFAAIGGLNAKVRELGENPMLDGYNYYFDNVSADTFSVTAAPQVYGVTGKKTYWVSESGIVVSEDLKGGRFADDPLSKTENVEKIQTIFAKYERTLSKKLLSAAEKNFKAGNYRLCQRILENLRNMLPNSSSMARLSAMEKENESFLAEAEAERLCADAENYIRSGKKDPALVMLRAVAADYPKTKAAQEAASKVKALSLELAEAELKLASAYIESNYWNAVEESLSKIERLYPEAIAQADFKDRVSICRKTNHDRRDQYALDLLAEAEKLEFREETVLSYNTYLQIKENYGDTPAAKDIDSALERLKSQMNEQTAEKYIAEIMRNVALSNEVVVVNMVSLIKNSCGDTKAYRRAADVLERARRDCTVSLLDKEADGYMAGGHYKSARDRLENMLKEKPECFVNIKGKFETCLVKNFHDYMASEDFEEALESYDRYMDMNPSFPAIEKEKVDECLYKSGLRLFQQGNMRLAAARLEMCYPTYLNDQQYNFVAGRANAVIKHWEPAARHLIACTDLGERQKLDLCIARSYSISNLRLLLENKLIAMFVANLEFQETVRNYKWLKIVYAKLSVTNDIENVSNVKMKIDREATTGEVIVTVESPESIVLSQFEAESMSRFERAENKESLLKKEISYQKALEVMLDRIRELQEKLEQIMKSHGKEKDPLREDLEMLVDRFDIRIKELEVIDKREREANEDIISQLDRDIIHHNAVLSDLRSILSTRSDKTLLEKSLNVTKKIGELKAVRRNLRRFINERKERNHKIDVFLKTLPEPILMESVTVEQVGEAAEKIRGYYLEENKNFMECVERFVGLVNIDIDLSELEQFLPKEKTENVK